MLTRFASGLVFLGLVLSAGRIGVAQSVPAVPKLDLNRYMGVWYEVARYPVKQEKNCASDGRILYALGDKKNSFQLGTFCEQKNGTPGSWGSSGKMGKTGDGRLKLSRLFILHSKYYVMATGSDYDWALVGTPNHKSLWILSRTATLPAETLTQIESTASGAGFKTDKLVHVEQHPTISATNIGTGATTTTTAQPAQP